MTKITQIERQALHGVHNSDFCDGNEPVDHYVWSWSANPFKEPRTFPGAVSSLSQKGLVKCTGEGEDACIALTQAGWDLIKNDN